MHPHQRMPHRGEGGALGLGVVGVSELTARMEDGMLAGEPIDLRLRGGVKCVIGGAQIGELGLAAGRRHDVREQHRERARRLAERRIRMPQPIAERVEAAVIVGPAQRVGGGEVRDVGELGVL